MIDAGGVERRVLALADLCLRLAGIAAFVVQQVSLGTGRLAPSVATTSVLNPVLSVLIGIVLLEETLSLPVWHKVVAWAGLALAMWGAIAISLAREGGEAAAEEAAAPAAQCGLDGNAGCGALQLVDLDLPHLHHRRHDALRLLVVRVVQQPRQGRRDDLPGEAEAVFQPAARAFLAALGQRRPVAVDLLLRLAARPGTRSPR